MSETILKVQHLGKSFGNNEILKDIDFSVKPKDVTCIIGPSGSGKSTLLRCMNLLETPSSGEIRYHGTNIMDKHVNVPEYRSKVGMVFQNFNLFNNMTVLKNCTVGQEKVLKKSKEEAHKNAMMYLEKVGMAPYINAKPKQLSGGQKQRVAIARALINRPRVLLLDEPLGALDLKLRKQMQLELKRLQKKLNITFIYVTHDQEEALTMSDRIAVMHDGIIDQLASPTEIYEHPATKFVATFIGETNIYDGCITRIEDGIAVMTLENGAVSVKCPEDFSLLEYATISVRPEKMKFAASPVEGFELEAQVKDYIYVGSVLKCIVSLPNGNELKIERLAGQDLPPIGSKCYPYWKVEDAVLIHNESHYIFEALNNIKLA